MIISIVYVLFNGSNSNRAECVEWVYDNNNNNNA